MKSKHLILSLFVTLIFCLVIGSTFIPYKILDNNFQMFFVSFFVGVSLLMSCVLLAFKRRFVIPFQFPDALLLLSVVYYLLRYDYNEHLADWKIYYAITLLIFWWSTRVLFSNFFISERLLIFAISLMGCVQVFWGILQLYNILPSYHNLYLITGSFYNPGPYTGYVGVFFPIALCQALNVSNKVERCIWIFILGLLVCVIPAGMSRSAWLAVLFGTLFVVTVYLNLYQKCKVLYNKYRRLLIICFCILVLAISVVVFLFAIVKPWSVCGRFFIWNRAVSAIIKSPLLGYGPGTFPYIYGIEQSSYFSEGNYYDWEKYVAGAPDFAFNEYLQMLVEGGMVLFILVLVFIFLTLYTGIKRKKYSACAGLFTFYVFALSAYPMQVLPFGIIVILLSSICISECKQPEYSLRRSYLLGGIYILYFVIFIISMSKLNDFRAAKDKILHAIHLYNLSMYAEAFSIFEANYDFIEQNPRILFLYADILCKQNNYGYAINILKRAEKLSNDVSILNAKAECYKEMGKYELAEMCYKQSINRMPIRLYPYYKLAKLYALPSYLNLKKMKEMAEFVLTHEPKVGSTMAVLMRKEMKELIGKEY